MARKTNKLTPSKRATKNQARQQKNLDPFEKCVRNAYNKARIVWRRGGFSLPDVFRVIVNITGVSHDESRALQAVHFFHVTSQSLKNGYVLRRIDSSSSKSVFIALYEGTGMFYCCPSTVVGVGHRELGNRIPPDPPLVCDQCDHLGFKADVCEWCGAPRFLWCEIQ